LVRNLLGEVCVTSFVLEGRAVVKERSEGARAVPDAGATFAVPRDATAVFDAFYMSRWHGAVRLGHAIVGSASVAEEIAQEAFLRVYSGWSGIESPDAFLRTVLVNLCRSNLRRAHLERSNVSAGVSSVLSEPELDETWIALRLLPFRQRAVLALRYYGDLSESEIAALLGCRLGTVKSTRHRALARLRKELS
jgi:RNA polymerase sigma factor (sigma-70 family)